MSLLDIIDDNYGQVIELTFLDVDTNAAADISSYSTTIQMVFTNAAGTETAKTATFKTTGSDGVIQYTLESGFLTAGQWKVRGKVATASKTLATLNHSFTVRS